MAGDEDALRDLYVGRCGEGGAVGELLDAAEAVGGHLVAADEEGLRLPRAPLVEALVVEPGGLVVALRVLVGYVAVDDGPVGDADVLIVAHRRREQRHILPPPQRAASGDVRGTAICSSVRRCKWDCIAPGSFFFELGIRCRASQCCSSDGRLTVQ